MIHTNRIRLGIVALGIVPGFISPAHAQQTTQPDVQQLRAYNVSREVFLLGTVVKFDSASDTPPMGAHVLLQTASGQVDVHLGNAKVLQTSHLELNPGDSVRIVAEPRPPVATTSFASRLVQKAAETGAGR